MKLLSVIATSVLAEGSWGGISVDNTCGQIVQGPTTVNQTCTITGNDISYIFAGNGAFITGPNSFTGFEGISGDAELVVFFEQELNDDGELDNSTCWDVEVNCVDNGGSFIGGDPLFMETVNDYRTSRIRDLQTGTTNTQGSNYNLQIANVEQGDVLSIQLNDFSGNAFNVQNISTPFGVVSAEQSTNGAFSVTVNEVAFGHLLQISVSDTGTNPGVLSLWSSTITA